MPKIKRIARQADGDRRLIAEDITVEECVGTGGNDQDGAERRQERRPSGKGAVAVEREQADRDQREADRRARLGGARPQNSSALLDARQGRAQHQLPCPGLR